MILVVTGKHVSFVDEVSDELMVQAILEEVILIDIDALKFTSDGTIWQLILEKL